MSVHDQMKEYLKDYSVLIPIRLHMVTSSSPTVFESSTMMVLIAPSSILIFCGRCFFLYSRTSYKKERGNKDLMPGWTADSWGLHHKPLFLLHFSAYSNPGFVRIRARFLSWDHRQTGRVRNRTLKVKHDMDVKTERTFQWGVTGLPPNLVLSELLGLSPWWSCRRHTPGWTAQTALSSPRCTGAHRSLVTKPPSWWIV